MKKSAISFAFFALAALASPSYASVEFHENDNGTNIVGVLLDNTYNGFNVRDKNWQNDAIRSVRLKYVSAGTMIRLFDHKHGKRNDDWVEIFVKKPGKSILVTNLERNFENEYYKQVYHRHNGLNGKVSHVQVTPGNGERSVRSKFFSSLEEVYQFRSKKGQAHELKSQDSNYRIWMPDMVISPTRTTITLKMDHIRGMANDDHASVDMSFDKNGYLTAWSFKISMYDDTPILASEKIGIPGPDTALAIAGLGAKLHAQITGKLAERGGRDNFKNVIESAVGNMADAMKDAAQ